MKGKITDYIPLLIFSITLIMGGGKFNYQFDIISLITLSILIVLLLNNAGRLVLRQDIWNMFIMPVLIILSWAIVTLFTTKCIYPTFLSITRIYVYAIFFILAYIYRGYRSNILIFSLLNILQSSLVLFQSFTGRIRYGFFQGENTNLAGGFIAALTVLAIGYLLINYKNINFSSRLIIFLSVVFGSASMLFSRSRSALIVFAIATGYILWMKFKVKGLAVYALIFALVIGLTGDKISERYMKLNDPLAFYRGQLWNSALKMLRDNPVYGVGLGNYSKVSPRYNFPITYSIARYGKQSDFAHNEFLHLGVEMGIPGLILFIFLVVNAIKVTSRLPYLIPPIITLLFQGLFDVNLHLPSNIFFLILLIATAVHEDDTGRKVKAENCIISSRLKPFLISFTALIGVLYISIFISDICARAGKYDVAIRFNPLNPEYYYKLSIKSTGDFNEKVDLIEKSTKLDPDNYVYHLNLGYLNWQLAYKDRRLVENTIGEFKETLRRNPYCPFAYFCLGKLSYDLEEYKKAKKYFLTAITHEPYFILARYFSIKCSIKLKEGRKVEIEKKKLYYFKQRIKRMPSESEEYIDRMINIDEKAVDKL